MGARSDNGVTGRARVVEKSRDGTAAQKTTVSDDTLPPGGASRHDWPEDIYFYNDTYLVLCYL